MELDAKSLCMHIVIGDNCPNSSPSLQKLLCLCTKGFVTKEFLDLHCLDELKNFAANISSSWYQILRFLLLVTAYFDNSGFSGVMTLNSPSRILLRWLFLFVNKSLVSNLFSVAFNLVGDLFVLPRILHVIESNYLTWIIN